MKIITCNHCQSEVILNDAVTNSCGQCGTDYNGFGGELAPRNDWGWETGENLVDIIN